MSSTECGSTNVCVSREKHKPHQDRISIIKCETDEGRVSAPEHESCHDHVSTLKHEVDGDRVSVQAVVQGHHLSKHSEARVKQCKACIFNLPSQHSDVCIKQRDACISDVEALARIRYE